ncbi:MAG: DMT family transporter [Coxiellaceae bacterium]|jgi:drug/metabolite transporter (DMT)-like permease|nr:DMT family transporter [Coxiellaceae bacterium]
MKNEPLRSEHITYAVTLSILAAICYSIMNLLVKFVTIDTTESMTVFFRFLVSSFWVILVFIYKRWHGKYFPIKTEHFGLHLIRAICSFISMFSLYYALKYVPLVDVTSLAMTYTLFIPILGSIFLGTKTNVKNWLAIITGFIGVIFILKPYSSNFDPITLVALISGLTMAISFLVLYELAKNDEPHTILLYYFSLTVILSGIYTTFSWKTPNLKTISHLLIIGVAGTAYHEFLTRSMSYASPKIVAPLLYSSIIFSGIFDWLFWHRMPDLYFWIGAILVIFGCIFLIRYTQE